MNQIPTPNPSSRGTFPSGRPASQRQIHPRMEPNKTNAKKPRPGDPAGTVENPKPKFPTAPWTAPPALTTGPPGPTTTSLQQENALGWNRTVATLR